MLQGLCGRHASTACGQNPDQRNHKEEHRYSTGQMPHTVTPLFGALVCLIYCLRSAKPSMSIKLVENHRSRCVAYHKLKIKMTELLQ
jgi:hypothetical protein